MSMDFDLNYEISRIKELYTKVKTVSDFENLAKIVRRSYEKHPDAEPLASWYLYILSEFLSKQDEVMEQEKILREARRVYKESQFLGTTFIYYFKTLSEFLIKQNDNPDLINIVNEAKQIYASCPQNEQLAQWYLSILCRYIWKKDDKSERINAVKEARRTFERFSQNEKVALWYFRVLYNFSLKQEDIYELTQTVDEAQWLYENFPPKEDLAIQYLNILFNLSLKQDNKDVQQNLINEVRKVYEENQASEKIATIYLRFLYNFSKNQSEDILNNATDQAKQFYERHQSSETVASWYLGFLLTTTEKQLNPLEMERTAKEINTLIQKHLKLGNIVENHFDNLLTKDTESYVDNCANLFMCFADQNSVKDYLMQTKYGIFYDSNELSPEEMKKLLQILSLVQTIKNQLIVKDPAALTFGHYTSAKVLQLLLRQGEEEKYAIKSKSRLCNVNYMNDPLEGKILNQFLNLDTNSQKISLKASPWFLMSLTTATDRLEMWAQYGKKGEGVCLVLDSNDFFKVRSLSDMKWLTTKRFPELLDVNSDNNRTEEDVPESKLVNGDCIYQIGYLEFSNETEGVLTIANNPRLRDAISIINSSLNSLRKNVGEIGKETILYEKVDECLEEIRYLFKSADYSYESELRILKYVPLEADNKNIKIDDSDEVAILYVERDNPIQIAEVIFGPKFQSPEKVTPLLHLLDKNIKFRQSEISYR